MTPGTADPELQALARRAQSGDKRAQLDLGIRYEEGRGVPVDRRRAERLYRIAAADDTGTIRVYSPPAGRNDSGRILALPAGRSQPGSREARVRLQRLAGAEPARPVPAADTSAAGANERIVSLWGDAVALLSSKGEADIDTGLRALENRSDHRIRIERQHLRCPAPADGNVFPVATAACADGADQASIVHVWDEELSPAGVRRFDTLRPGCMNIATAYSMLAGWRPKPFFYRSPVTLPADRNNNISVNENATPEIVYSHDSGNMIYMYYYSRENCLSNFYLIIPNKAHSSHLDPSERR